MPKLHVNIDHVATLRQARREVIPDPIEWALRAEKAGAVGITAHLRTDRRHIQDADIKALKRRIKTRLNFEMSLAPEIVAIALRTKPHAVCLVPENRAEVTTEGGLDVVKEHMRLLAVVPRLIKIGAEVSLFIDPDHEQVEAALEVGAEFVELHTGSYARATGAKKKRELLRLQRAAKLAHECGLRVNAGHGLDYENVAPIAALPHVEELNIGFAIVARSVFTGVDEAVSTMAKLVRGRSKARSA
ncbi:MAG: pyridoxine 5'-phosphate synthase [Planctomycetes bacterium]|nr:pyridoxine 5'-phosphate synthase [Planctomycetota bacterium]